MTVAFAVIGGVFSKITQPGTLPVTAGLAGQYTAATGVSTTAGRVASWADQSGAGNDAVQATSGNRPYTGTDWKGRPVLRLSGLSNTGMFLTAPTGTVNLDASSVFVVAAAHLTGGQQRLIGQGAPTGYPLIDFDQFSAPTIRQLTRPGPALMTANPFAVGYTTPSPTATHAVGSLFPVTTLTAGGGITGSGAGITIGGNASGGVPANADLYEVLVYNRALTDSEAGQVITYLDTKYSLRTAAPTRQLYIEGDSIIAGSASATGFNLGLAARTDGNTAWRILNNAVAGSTVASISGRASFDDGFRDGTLTRNVLYVSSGRNDMGGGLTPAQTYAALKTYCAARVAAGWEVWVGTLIGGAGGSAVTDATYNALIRGTTGAGIIADVPGVTHVVDFQTNPALTDSSNGTYFLPDATHPTDAGSQAMGDVLAAVIAAA